MERRLSAAGSEVWGALYWAVLRKAGPFVVLPPWEKERYLMPAGLVLLLVSLAFRLNLLALASLLLMLAVRLGYAAGHLRSRFRARYWSSRKSRLVEKGRRGHFCLLEELELEQAVLDRIGAELARSPVVEIAEVDGDGFLRSRFGRLPGAADLGERNFLKRTRTRVTVVVAGGRVGVRKEFGREVRGFISELEALDALAGSCNVPSLMDVDFENLAITLSYVPGRVVREELAARGAVLRDADVGARSDLMSLGEKERWQWRIAEGRRVLPEVMSTELADRFFEELRKIHRCGVCLNDVKYGNLVIAKGSNEPFFLDFENSLKLPKPRGALWEAYRDFDTDMFNLHFGTGKATGRSIAEGIPGLLERGGEYAYQSVRFRKGLVLGSPGDARAGERLWRAIREEVLPDIAGARVLGVDCKNAYFLMEMLRDGVSEAVGMEADRRAVRHAGFVREGFEWADSRAYELRMAGAGSPGSLLAEEGPFEAVFFFNGRRERTDGEIEEILAHAGGRLRLIVFWPGTLLGRGEVASEEGLGRVLSRGGFRAVTTRALPPADGRLLVWRRGTETRDSSG